MCVYIYIYFFLLLVQQEAGGRYCSRTQRGPRLSELLTSRPQRNFRYVRSAGPGAAKACLKHVRTEGSQKMVTALCSCDTLHVL